VVSFKPQSFYPHGNSPWYPLGRRLGGPQSQSGYGGEEKIKLNMLNLNLSLKMLSSNIFKGKEMKDLRTDKMLL